MIWGVSQDNQVFFCDYKDSPWANPGASWVRISANWGASQISIGEMGVFCVTTGGKLYYRIGTYNSPDSQGSDWQP